MNPLPTIISILLVQYAFGQKPTNITGTVVDENGKAVVHAMLRYKGDTAYTDSQGSFSVAYPNPQLYFYYFHITREEFLPKSVFIDVSSTDIVIKNPISIRSRKGFWFDSRKIDSTHIGITVRDATKKYKLDIEDCLLWDEPPGKYYGFTTEFADSSYVLFTIQGVFNIDKRLNMSDILDQKIIGFGIADIYGSEKIIGNGTIYHNPYFIEQKIKLRNR